MLRTIVIVGAIWFVVAVVLGLVMGRWLRQRDAPNAVRQEPQRFRNSA